MRLFGRRQIICNRNKTEHLVTEKHFLSCIPEVGFQFAVHQQLTRHTSVRKVVTNHNTQNNGMKFQQQLLV
jgi:hypothetical protein